MGVCKICFERFVPRYSTLECCCEKQTCIDSYVRLRQEKKRAKVSIGPKRIKKVSVRRSDLNKLYEKVRLEVLCSANFKCFVDGCTRTANTIEHRMGKRGFADDFGRENNIPLLIDKRFLSACCFRHNIEFETNSALSRQYQLSKIHGGVKKP